MTDRYRASRPNPGVNLSKDAPGQPGRWSNEDTHEAPGVSLSKDSAAASPGASPPPSYPPLAPPPPFAAPASWPAAAPAGPPPPMPDHLPQGTFPQRAPQLPLPAAPPSPGRGTPPPAGTQSVLKRRGVLAGILAALVVIVVLIVVVANAGGSKKTPAGQHIQNQPVAQATQATTQTPPNTSAPPSSAATPSPTPTPTPTRTSVAAPLSRLARYHVHQQVGPEQGDCVGDSFGQVQQFLQDEDPCSLTRSLYSGQVDSRPVTISVSTLTQIRE